MKLSQQIILGMAIALGLFLGFQLGTLLSDQFLIIWGIALLVGLLFRFIAQFLLTSLSNRN
ncbi:hypothetical protein CEH05_07970 [Halobacillus halophilus]|uniref:Uncharacterized protein n=1 Tax=Halobacillus halophilus (strain ATCC 35676 / DSM 2266 / JCM 20832 / KCTC 3685 / LMG 17431 / NBRC 102448 / NCIMB 2269) TaxID=866895 RepID=I0JLB8_HALH3|nr:hypothetical protein [Halobacillus halophilus]ASF39053.1 hypothetical protein CEH05_07970 [Halobacillus halophilus]CCG44938.1 hypothetical protein HBHAL_2592 [Halobacillus halophilus DSM 2266]